MTWQATATERAYLLDAIASLSDDEVSSLARAFHEAGMEGSPKIRAERRRNALRHMWFSNHD